MSARDDILRALRAATSMTADTIHPIEPPEYRHAAGTSPDPDALIALFRDRLHDNGAEVIDVPSWEALPGAIAAFAEQHRITSAIVAGHDVLAHAHVREGLAAVPGVERVLTETAVSAQGAAQYRSTVSDVMLGVGCAQAGIADAGAVAVLASPLESRSLSLLTDVHIAVLDARDLVPSLHECMAELVAIRGDRHDAPVTLISGPSKTADIEKVLITGVHGPRTFAVALVQPPSTTEHSPSSEHTP